MHNAHGRQDKGHVPYPQADQPYPWNAAEYQQLQDRSFWQRGDNARVDGYNYDQRVHVHVPQDMQYTGASQSSLRDTSKGKEEFRYPRVQHLPAGPFTSQGIGEDMSPEARYALELHQHVLKLLPTTDKWALRELVARKESFEIGCPGIFEQLFANHPELKRLPAVPMEEFLTRETEAAFVTAINSFRFQEEDPNDPNEKQRFSTCLFAYLKDRGMTDQTNREIQKQWLNAQKRLSKWRKKLMNNPRATSTIAHDSSSSYVQTSPQEQFATTVTHQGMTNSNPPSYSYTDFPAWGSPQMPFPYEFVPGGGRHPVQPLWADSNIQDAMQAQPDQLHDTISYPFQYGQLHSMVAYGNHGIDSSSSTFGVPVSNHFLEGSRQLDQFRGPARSP